MKYTDPDGRDIYHFSILGVGKKYIAGGHVVTGIAMDDEGHTALFLTGDAGFGFESKINLPGSFNLLSKILPSSIMNKLSPSVNVMKNKNLSDLSGEGVVKFIGNFDLKNITINIDVLISIIYDPQANEITGIGDSLGIGGGVNLVDGTLYIDITQMSIDFKKEIKDTVDYIHFKIGEFVSEIFRNINKRYE